MEPKAYALWLAGGPKGPLVEEGAKLFQTLACIKCHKEDGSGLLPGGSTVDADEAYIRESILDPAAKVDCYQAHMPVFKGLVTDKEVDALVAYIKTMVRKPAADSGGQAP